MGNYTQSTKFEARASSPAMLTVRCSGIRLVKTVIFKINLNSLALKLLLRVYVWTQILNMLCCYSAIREMKNF
jgi:hypothetical protein